MPNPARERVTFQYNLESDVPATLSLYGINGNFIRLFALEGQQGQFDWQTERLPQGIYYCRANQPGKAYPSLKLVLVK